MNENGSIFVIKFGIWLWTHDIDLYMREIAYIKGILQFNTFFLSCSHFMPSIQYKNNGFKVNELDTIDCGGGNVYCLTHGSPIGTTWR